MTILREVIARFSIEADTKPLTDAEKRIDRFNEKLKGMATAVGGAWVAAGAAALHFTNQASGAAEAAAAIGVIFRENSDHVFQWSKDLGAAIGRSEFDLQMAAKNFGAFMDPIFKGTGRNVAAMSEKMAELAVDLASFYDTSDEEAQMRLFSGLSGETEAVRRLGIDISDSSLKEMHEKAGGRNMAGQVVQYKALSMAEKTMLRFNKILADSVNAHGDAIRSLDRWSGVSKQLQAKWKTFSVLLGRITQDQLLPLAKTLLDWADRIGRLVLESSALETGVRMLVISTALLAAQFAILNPALAATIGLAAGLTLAFEDLITFLDGGNSIIGEFLTNLTGASDPLQLWNRSMEQVIYGLDLMSAGLLDLVEGFKYAINRLILGEKLAGPAPNWDNTRAVRWQKTKMDENRKAVADSNLRSREAAAAAGDLEAFDATYKGHTATKEQKKADFNALRLQALTSGNVQANLDDVADNIVSRDFVTQQARERIDAGMAPTADQVQAATDRSAEQVALEMHINIEKIDNLQEGERQAFFDEVARRTREVLQERR